MTLETHHDLHSQFPEAADKLHALKLDSAHFRKVADEYDALSKAIYRAETEVEPTSDEHLEDMKKRRLALLDEVAALIAN